MGSQGLGHCPRKARRALREFFSQGVTTDKSDVDIVTVADRTAEKLIREQLAQLPEHGIYGEEQHSKSKLPLVLDVGRDHQLCAGFRSFCVSNSHGHRQVEKLAGVRRVRSGRGREGFAVIYDPLRERFAERGTVG